MTIFRTIARTPLRSATAILAATALAACGSAEDSDEAGGNETAAAPETKDEASDDHEGHDHGDHDHDHEGHDHDHDHDHGNEGDSDRPEASEAAGPTPRLAATYDGGVMVLDGKTLEELETFGLKGFTRLSPAGDGRHVMIAEGQKFRALDLGTWTEPHGDHTHSFEADPFLTDIEFEADKPGHVVPHGGVTALYSDGSGLVEWFDPAELAKGKPKTEQWTAPEAHHGVAVRMENGSMITTLSKGEDRPGIVVLDKDGKELAKHEDCPGVHGEAAAGEETVVFGCQDGMLIVKGTDIEKVDSPDSYGRMGNVFGHDESTMILADYKVDKDAELERPTRVSVVDTEKKKHTLVDVEASYSFRSLGRDHEGQGLVLGTDGQLRRIDMDSAKVDKTVEVVKKWEEPVVWQEPRPTLSVVGETAYVSEPASNEIHIVDLKSFKVTDSVKVNHTPNELSGVTG